jgi:hypothetical protein
VSGVQRQFRRTDWGEAFADKSEHRREARSRVADGELGSIPMKPSDDAWWMKKVPRSLVLTLIAFRVRTRERQANPRLVRSTWRGFTGGAGKPSLGRKGCPPMYTATQLGRHQGLGGNSDSGQLGIGRLFINFLSFAFPFDTMEV